MTSRQTFNISTDTGTHGDTGPPFSGAIQQMRWSPTTGDTGGDLRLSLVHKASDTGEGFVFFDDNDCLGANFTRVPRQFTHDISGAPDQTDTGTPASPAPIVGAGDRIRVKVTPGGAAVAGRLYIWTGE